MLVKLFKRFHKCNKGTSILEFALVLPILLALVIGIIEFGWILNGWITITGAAREGARVAVVGNEDADVVAAVERHIQHLGTLQAVAIEPGSAEGGEERVVEVSGALPLLTGFFSNKQDASSIIPLPLIPDPFPLSGVATMRQEHEVYYSGED